MIMAGPQGRGPAQVSIESRESDPELQQRRRGATYFPERLLGAAVITTVGRQNGRLLYVTASPVLDADQQVDYYLGLLGDDQRAKSTQVRIVSVDDDSCRWLSEKVLDPDNPRAAQVRTVIGEFVERERHAGAPVHLSYFEPSLGLERFARALGVPGNQADAVHIPLGTKHASRQLFVQAGIEIPAGTPLCRSVRELAERIADLTRLGYRRVLVKLDGTTYAGAFGQALLDLRDLDASQTVDQAILADRILIALPRAVLRDTGITWADFARVVEESGAIAEELVGNGTAPSPSFQGRLADDGTVEVISTHEQVFEAQDGTFTGCAFPASAAYRREVIDCGVRVGRALVSCGVTRGDFGVDFLATWTTAGWRLLGCEINLRATATKHALTMVCGLLDTSTTADGCILVDGAQRVYEATDSLADPRYVGLRPRELIRAVAASPLGYDPARRSGVVLHMMSSAIEHGKFGAVSIGVDSAQTSAQLVALRELVDSLAVSRRAAGQQRSSADSKACG